jgi:hypothetical protein
MRAFFPLFFSTFFSFNIFAQILPGAYQIEQIVALTKNKRVAIITNHTAMLGNVRRYLAEITGGYKKNIFARTWI